MNRLRFLVQDENYKSICSQHHQFVEKAPLCPNKCTAVSAEELQLLMWCECDLLRCDYKTFYSRYQKSVEKERMNYGSLGKFVT